MGKKLTAVELAALDFLIAKKQAEPDFVRVRVRAPNVRHVINDAANLAHATADVAVVATAVAALAAAGGAKARSLSDPEGVTIDDVTLEQLLAARKAALNG